jgi:hypothetical protein
VFRTFDSLEVGGGLLFGFQAADVALSLIVGSRYISNRSKCKLLIPMVEVLMVQFFFLVFWSLHALPFRGGESSSFASRQICLNYSTQFYRSDNITLAF